MNESSLLANIKCHTPSAIQSLVGTKIATILRVTAGRSLLIFTHRHIFLDQMDQAYIIYKQHLSPYTP